MVVSYKLLQFIYSCKKENNNVTNDTSNNCSKALTSFTLVSLNAGLLMVDHIHFQYNGLLLGLLLLSVYCCAVQCYRAAALSFSILVLMKHLYVPLAPVLAVFFLRHFCGFGNVNILLPLLHLKYFYLLLLIMFRMETTATPQLLSLSVA